MLDIHSLIFSYPFHGNLINVIEFKFSIIFQDYCIRMNELEQRAILKDIGVKTFHKGECTGDFKRELLC